MGGGVWTGQHKRLTAEGFKGKRGRGIPKHADCIMGVFAGVAVDGSSLASVSRNLCGAQWRSLPFSAVPPSPSCPGKMKSLV